MKKIILTTLFCISFCYTTIHAQTFFRGEQTIIQPLQVMIDNYTGVTITKEISTEPNAGRFDKFNLYTYLQIIRDDMGKDYHILFQTNFSGKILFLAYSNNLSMLFNKPDKPFNVFVNCIRTVNDQLSALQHADAAVKCIIDRLNYCSN